LITSATVGIWASRSGWKFIWQVVEGLPVNRATGIKTLAHLLVWSAVNHQAGDGRHGAQAVRFAPPVTHQIGDGEAMILAAAAGVGLCQMPRCLFKEDIDAGRLVEVLSDYEPEPVDVHAVWPKVSHLRPKVRYVVDELVKLCEQWQ
jgi:DNA-binding transcriptional LysR family regulator